LQDIQNGPTDSKWMAALLGALTVSTIISVVIKVISIRLEKMAETTTSTWDDTLVGFLRRLRFFSTFVWFFYGFSYHLQLLEKFAKSFQVALVASVVVQFVIWGQYGLLRWKQDVLDEQIKENPSASPALGLIYRLSQFGLIAIAVLMGLSNVGVDIGALLAGLGVGGIAVALAAQNILGDLLASLSIVLDKPFSVGDFIITGEVRGKIENIGIKTTRIRSLTGEQIIVSNKDLLQSRIQNFQRLVERRSVKQIGVVYSTKPSDIEKIPHWIRSIIETAAPEKVRFDRCHFINFGQSSLDFEFVFYVAEADYVAYMVLQEKILIDIMKKFAEEDIQFAFPTQTIFLGKGEARA
jgi:small-conductance mechanosensitive channel